MSGAERGHMNKSCSVTPFCQVVSATGWHGG